MFEELVSNLKRLREIQGKDQATVSVYMDYSLSSSLSHIESGNRGVSSEALVKWLYALDIDVTKIVQDAINGVNFDLVHQAVNQGVNVNQIIEREIQENE